ncbi:hypothetical protein [Brunnivagina elsteri]|uniref:hypothetical protein n=1 Tax=Brunnivagina elsteri TaxID=1247191 RepID=UPI0013042A06|nr:hypothetical protein [Calothrix elsteri]
MNEPPNSFKNALGEAMGALVILLLLMPLAAITVRGAVEITTKPMQCINSGKQ